MAKLLHTSDVHLGKRLSGLGKAGDRVRSAIKTAFSDVIDTAISEKVDALLIVGDLFDSNNVSTSLVRFALGEIRRLGEIPCLVLPGIRDPVEEGSVLLGVGHDEKPSNMSIFTNPEHPTVHLEDQKLTFYGIPSIPGRTAANPITAVKRKNNEGRHILLAYGAYSAPDSAGSGDSSFTLGDIDGSGFDYVALGHMHSFFELPSARTKAAYSGSPETFAVDQTGAGQVLIVDIGDQVSLRRKNTGKAVWRQLELPSDSFRYTIEVEQEIQKHADENMVLRVRLTGRSSSDGFINIDGIIDQLGDSFMHLSISDETEWEPRDLLELNLPPTTILGQFIRKVTDAIEQAEEPERKQLLSEGLRTGYALLSGRDVL